MDTARRMAERSRAREVEESTRRDPAFTDSQLNLAFAALASPTRRAILRVLEGNSLCVSDIVDHFQLSQPTISKHLSVLRKAELVTDQRSGQQVFYRLDMPMLKDLVFGFLDDFGENRRQLRSLARAIATAPPLQRGSDSPPL